MRGICLSIGIGTVMLVAGCSRGDDAGNNMASEGSASANLAEADRTPPATPPPGQTDAGAEADSGTDIPPMIRGRWGIVPADCTSTHGDAKGLLEISPDTLTFYESRGTLATIVEHEPSRIRATFSFEGEGMSWTRDMVLDAQDDGTVLIRKELGPDAAPAPIRYRRCAS